MSLLRAQPRTGSGKPGPARASGSALLGSFGWLFLQVDALFYGLGALLGFSLLPAVVLVAIKLLLVGAVIAVRSTRNRDAKSKLAPTLFGAVVLSASINFLRWGDGDPSQKYVLYALTLGLPALVVGMCLSDRDLFAAAGFGTVVAVCALLLFIAAYDGAAADDSGYLNDVGGASHLLIGQSVVIILILSASEWVRQRRNIVNLTIFIAGIFLLFVSGSRGSLISAVLAVSFYGAASMFSSRRHEVGRIVRRSVVMLIVALVSAYLVFERLPSDSLARHKYEALLDGGDRSTQLREYWQRMAWDQFRENALFGQGVGGFAHHLNAYVYPHSIFFELLADFGVFGFVLMVFVGLRIVRPGGRGDPSGPLGRAYLVAAATILMFSGSYAIFPLFWFALGLTSPVQRANGQSDLSSQIVTQVGPNRSAA